MRLPHRLPDEVVPPVRRLIWGGVEVLQEVRPPQEVHVAGVLAVRLTKEVAGHLDVVTTAVEMLCNTLGHAQESAVHPCKDVFGTVLDAAKRGHARYNYGGGALIQAEVKVCGSFGVWTGIGYYTLVKFAVGCGVRNN